jgi:hypothetical protein
VAETDARGELLPGSLSAFTVNFWAAYRAHASRVIRFASGIAGICRAERLSSRHGVHCWESSSVARSRVVRSRGSAREATCGCLRWRLRVRPVVSTLDVPMMAIR